MATEEQSRVLIRPDKQRLGAYRSFITAHAEIIGRIERDLAAAGVISLTWYDVLIELYEAPERRLRLHELARAVVLSRSGLTRTVDRLEAAGLLRREPDPTGPARGLRRADGRGAGGDAPGLAGLRAGHRRILRAAPQRRRSATPGGGLRGASAMRRGSPERDHWRGGAGIEGWEARRRGVRKNARPWDATDAEGVADASGDTSRAFTNAPTEWGRRRRQRSHSRSRRYSRLRAIRPVGSPPPRNSKQ